MVGFGSVRRARWRHDRNVLSVRVQIPCSNISRICLQAAERYEQLSEASLKLPDQPRCPLVQRRAV